MPGRSGRKLSDYCNIFAEKTNRIGRNVGNFMHSRGLFTGRRSTDESNLTTAHRSNGNVIRTDYRFPDRLEDEGNGREANRHRYGRSERNHRDRSVYPKNVYPQVRNDDANYVDRNAETQTRRSRRHELTDTYQDLDTWAAGPSDLNGSKPILRNDISHSRGERFYSSTLPRRSRTINFRDQSGSLEFRRGYPKSLQDLSDLELEDGIRDHQGMPSFLSNDRAWRDDSIEDGYRRRRLHREDQLEDEYLRLYRSLSRLDKYSPGGRYEPGQVHYERECRTFGKDTVAFIYYKTCYL